MGSLVKEETFIEPALVPRASWYVIHTRFRWEKKVTRQLELKEIGHYCPMNKVRRQWSDRKKIVLEPLFSGYVFVQLTDIKQIRFGEIGGANNFVYWLSKPAVVRTEEIDTIKKFMNDFDHVELEKVPVRINDTVKILGGPLLEREGNVLEIRNRTVKVYLPTLGYNLIAEVEKSNIEIVSLRSRIESFISTANG